ncbi:MAG: hypothetical protein ACON5B_01135 [Myxococcota bacterium]
MTPILIYYGKSSYIVQHLKAVPPQKLRRLTAGLALDAANLEAFANHLEQWVGERLGPQRYTAGDDVFRFRGGGTDYMPNLILENETTYASEDGTKAPSVLITYETSIPQLLERVAHFLATQRPRSSREPKP